MEKHNLIGNHYGKLTVIAEAPDRFSASGNKRRYVLCLCDCGNIKEVLPNHLKAGRIISCTCEHNRITSQINRTHGATRGERKSEYKIWKGLRQRCLNPKNRAYENYGGRGITVCDRWLESFDFFYADLGARPSPKHSIDREDVNGNYEPSNCRWVLSIIQANNTRKNVFIEYKNVTYTMSQLCELLNLKYDSFKHFYRARHLPLEQAIAKAKKL